MTAEEIIERFRSRWKRQLKPSFPEPIKDQLKLIYQAFMTKERLEKKDGSSKVRCLTITQEERLHPDLFEQDFYSACCYPKNIDVDQLYKNMLTFQSHSQSERNDMLYNFMANFYDSETKKFFWRSDGRSLCNKCFCFKYGIPQTTFDTHKRKYRNGIQRAIHGNKGGDPQTPSISKPKRSKSMVG